MGKGDKKTKRGKIYSGTFGVRRSRKKSLTGAVIATPPTAPDAGMENSKTKAASSGRKKATKK